jgi:N-acetylglucosamine kinase-like BadF-type ATPase
VNGDPILVGVDVGATTTHILACRVDGTNTYDQVLATHDWRGAGAAAKAQQIAEFTARAVAGGELAGLGVGAHGCDSEAQCHELADAVRPLVAAPCVIVNDARLVGLATGWDKAVSVVAGTGSIAVGVLPDGGGVYAGGWGWLLGDEGGATGLVREAVRAALRAADDGSDDVLASHLASAARVRSVRRLPMVMMTTPPTVWADFARAIFLAADGGSSVAKHVIEQAGRDLAELTETVIRKGAVAEAVVAGGSTIIHQPRLADAFIAAVRRRRPNIEVRILTDPPVHGAIALARTAARTGSDSR